MRGSQIHFQDGRGAENAKALSHEFPLDVSAYRGVGGVGNEVFKMGRPKKKQKNSVAEDGLPLGTVSGTSKGIRTEGKKKRGRT